MHTKFTKLAVLIGLMSASAVTFASQACCGDIACCLRQWASCCL